MVAQVLVLDDDTNVHELIEHRLNGLELTLEGANDVESAIKLLSSNTYDLFMIDIVMGAKLSSEQVLAFLHSDKNSLNPALPLLIMSSHIDESHEKRFYQKSKLVAKVMKKPLDSIELRKFFKDFFGLGERFENDQDELIRTISGTTEHIEEELTTVKGQREDLTEDVIKIKAVESAQKSKQKIDFNIDERDVEGNSLFLRCAKHGNLNDCKLLLSMGANPIIKNKKGQSALHFAVVSGDVDVVDLIMEKGLDLNLKDDQNLEPLSYAILRGNAIMVTHLLEKGAKSNRRVRGRSYLMLACLRGDIEIFRTLLYFKPDLTVKDLEGKQIIDYLKAKNRKNFLQLFKSYYPDFSN